MASILEYEENGNWIPINALDTDTVDGKHAVGTLATNEQNNLTLAINEVVAGEMDILMLFSMGGIL